jgi:hypothetical protein
MDVQQQRAGWGGVAVAYEPLGVWHTRTDREAHGLQLHEVCVDLELVCERPQLGHQLHARGTAVRHDPRGQYQQYQQPPGSVAPVYRGYTRRAHATCTGGVDGPRQRATTREPAALVYLIDRDGVGSSIVYSIHPENTRARTHARGELSVPHVPRLNRSNLRSCTRGMRKAGRLYSRVEN